MRAPKIAPMGMTKEGRVWPSHYRITGGPLGHAVTVERNGVVLTTVTALKVEADVKGLVQVTLTEYAEVDIDVEMEPADARAEVTA